MTDIAEAERFINSLIAQPDMLALDQALAVLDAEDLRVIVRRLIIDLDPSTAGSQQPDFLERRPADTPPPRRAKTPALLSGDGVKRRA